MRTRWSTRLSEPLKTKDGGTLLTLADARRYVLAMKDGRENRSEWVAAIRLMMEVAEGAGDMHAVTQQLKSALMADAQ